MCGYCPCPCPWPLPCPCPCPCPLPRPCPLHKSLLIFRFGLFRNASFFVLVRSETVSKHRNKPNFFFSFAKKNLTEPKQIAFRFVSVRTETQNFLFQGHPTITNAWIAPIHIENHPPSSVYIPTFRVQRYILYHNIGYNPLKYDILLQLCLQAYQYISC